MNPSLRAPSNVRPQSRAGLVAGLVVAIGLGAAPAQANILGSASLDGFGRFDSALGNEAEFADCDALRRDAQLRNAIRPSRRKAMIRACEARQQEIWVAGSPIPGSVLPPPR